MGRPCVLDEDKQGPFMRTAFLIAAALTVIGGTMATAPAHAQDQRVIVVYGNDPCPVAKEGEEIIVCPRRPESERYRLPKRFREQEVAPGNANESWAVRSEALNEASPTGISKCSTVGPAGWTGCYAQFLREAQADRRAQRAANNAIPSVNDRPLSDVDPDEDDEK
jgi:hypothetical protein